MAVLHVIEQGARVGLSQGRVTISIDDREVNSVPARKVSLVVVAGNVRFSTPALTFFMRNGVSVHFCSVHGQLHGLAGSLEVAPATRIAAQLAACESAEGLGIAKEMLGAKLHNTAMVLRRMSGAGYEVEEERVTVDVMINRLEHVRSRDECRGIEGSAAAAYFRALRTQLGTFGFLGRSMRPPLDPVNATLSYGYSLLGGRVTLAVYAAGLHPEVGLLHAMTRRNHALVFDVMEEFRIPAVDLVVASAFLDGRLNPVAHFEDQNGGIYLNDEGKRTVIPLFERRYDAEFVDQTGRKNKLDDIVRTAARRVAAAVEGRREYTGFRMKA